MDQRTQPLSNRKRLSKGCGRLITRGLAGQSSLDNVQGSGCVCGGGGRRFVLWPPRSTLCLWYSILQQRLPELLSWSVVSCVGLWGWKGRRDAELLMVGSGLHGLSTHVRSVLLLEDSWSCSQEALMPGPQHPQNLGA